MAASRLLGIQLLLPLLEVVIDGDLRANLLAIAPRNIAVALLGINVTRLGGIAELQFK